MECRIFYSWQKNLPGGTNRSFIEGELDAVAKALTADDEIVVDTIVDRDTSGVAGSPDIGQTIFKKINAATVFVCDVSIINSKAPDKRKAPNPNVLVELGYALKALGWERVLMVMNTAYGPPELLPFDLKQKRAMTYDLQKGAPKDAARKQLRPVLTDAIRLIVTQYQAALATAALRVPSAASDVIESLRANRADQGPRAKRFVESVAKDLESLGSRGDANDRASNLLKSLEKTRPLVDQFGRVADAAAQMNSEEGVRGLIRGFGSLLQRYSPPADSAARPLGADPDLFRFVGHEMFVVLFAHLVTAERWSLVADASSEQVPRGLATVGVNRLSSALQSLGERSARSSTSLHADLLKQRHEGVAPVGNVTFEDFLSADLLLFLATFKPGSPQAGAWRPRSGEHLEDTVPQILSGARTTVGAQTLAVMLNEGNSLALKTRIKTALVRLRQVLQPSEILEFFDPEDISTF